MIHRGDPLTHTLWNPGVCYNSDLLLVHSIMKDSRLIIKKNGLIVWISYIPVTDHQEREVSLYFNFLTASPIESVREQSRSGWEWGNKTLQGISFSKTLVEVKLVISRNHSSTKTGFAKKKKNEQWEDNKK